MSNAPPLHARAANSCAAEVCIYIYIYIYMYAHGCECLGRGMTTRTGGFQSLDNIWYKLRIMIEINLSKAWLFFVDSDF